MKIALAHDYLVQYGGAERVLECFAELFPDAPIYTLIYDEKAMHNLFKGKNIKTSFLQKVPFAKKHHRIFPMLMPIATEQFDFSDFDLVLSDSSGFIKGIITGPETLHISYIHTPMRYAWDDCQKYTSDFYFPNFIKKTVPFFMNFIRIWDRLAIERVDKILCNSSFVKRRIKKYYHKTDCEVIYPPVNFDDFYIADQKGDYFLMVGRLLMYKRFDIVIQAFNALGYKLKIIGRGPEMKRFQKMAKSNIEFLGRVPDEDLVKYYSECRAFIFPQEEDFGIVAIEALASGCPVIAYRGGDVPEHIEDGVSGILFEKQTARDVFDAVKRFEKIGFSAEFIREKARKFDKSVFKDKIKKYVEEVYKKHKEK